jgi:hypothetical protein
MRRLALLLLGWLVWLAAPVHAEEVWLLGADRGALNALAAALRPALPPGHGLALQRLGDGSRVECPGARLVVAQGDEATRAALRGCPQARVWALGLTALGLESLREDVPHRLSGVVTDLPPERQVDLLELLRPRPRRVALPYSPAAETLARAAAKVLEARGFQPVLLPSRPDAQPLRPLHEVLGEVQAVLALPDPALYHEGLLKHWLLMTAREGVPMVGGLGAQDVRRGVVVAAVQEEQAAIALTARLLPELLGPAPLPPVQMLDQARVLHNPLMLSRLGLRLEEGE